MQFYKNAAEHIEMVLAGLGNDLGVEFKDYVETYLDNGYSAFSFIVGDIEPQGINSIGQQVHDIEMELQMLIPVSKESGGVKAQLYAVGVATKVCELLRTKYYGLDNQRLAPEIEVNRALPISSKQGRNLAGRHFVGRSIVFKQVVYLGGSTESPMSIEFNEPIHYE